MTVKEEDVLHIESGLANSRLERLFALGREINDTRSKIKIATDHLGNGWVTDTSNEAMEDLELARETLRRDLEEEIAEARELMPVVGELVSEFEGQIRSIENKRKVHGGLARIEEMRGEPLGAVEHRNAAGEGRKQIRELQSFIAALGDLKRDVTSRREVISCPKCSSYDFHYRITPSELGFSLFKCNRCSNAWRIQHFSFQIG